MNKSGTASSEAILEDLFGSDDESEDGVGPSLKATTSGENLTLSAVVEMAEVGGNRGLVALSRIPPGVLILAETPSVTWNNNNLEEEEDLVATVEACLLNRLAHKTTKILHPICLANCDEDEIRRAEELLKSERISEIASKVGETSDEVLRVLLALQHNGFGSGLYGVLTMLNHSCSPNCIKFSPSTGSSGASEIWTVSQIEKGDELTICYCEPLEMTKESMQEYLEAHHRFICKCPSCTKSTFFENSLPEEQQHLFQRTKVQERKLQDIITGMEQELQFLRNLDDIEVGFESVVKLMKATTDLSSVESDESTKDKFSVNPRVLARLCKLAANAAVLCLEYADKSSMQHRRPKEILVKSSAFSFLRNSLCLLSHQMKYIGSYHPDIASSHFDISGALDCCLKHYPDELISALNAPIDENYAELNLLQIPRPQMKPLARETQTPVLVTKRAIKNESNRFRAKGAMIKNLYSRNGFPSRLTTLREGLPGVCHWGDLIPAHHLELLINNPT